MAAAAIAIGGVVLGVSRTPFALTVASAAFAVSLYVFLSFFLPLPLPALQTARERGASREAADLEEALEHPDVRVEIRGFTEERSERQAVLVFPAVVTNRSVEPASLQFRLGVAQPHGQPTTWIRRYRGRGENLLDVEPPLSVAAQTTVLADLRFPVAETVLEEVRTKTLVGEYELESVPGAALSLEIADLISAATWVQPIRPAV